MDLESCKAKLLKNTYDFLRTVAQYVFTLDSRPDICGVPKEWHYGSKDLQKEWHKAVKLLNELKINVVETYDELIRMCRKKLAVH